MAFCAPAVLKPGSCRDAPRWFTPGICHRSHRRCVPKPSCAPKAIITLPPAPTVLLLTGACRHPIVPQAFRGPPAAFLVATLLANLSFLPANAYVYSALIDIAPAAVCLLLLQPPSVRTSRGSVVEMRQLLIAFIVGAVGTTVGAIAAGILCPLEPEAICQMASAFAATYIGGSVNYVGIVRALNVPNDLAAAGLAADMAAMAMYFAGLFSLASRIKIESRLSVGSTSKKTINERGRLGKRMLLVSVPLILTACLTISSRILASSLNLPAGSDLILMSGLSVVLARFGRMQPYLRYSACLGDVAVTAFFASLGATARVSAVAGASPMVLGVAVVVLVVHALVMITVGWGFFRIPGKLLLLASNANVGGASTAAAFAAACGWCDLVAGAVLVGTLGYLAGTPVGLLVFRVLRRLVG